jgi:hypothetical protein
MSEAKLNLFQRMMGDFCHHCPVCSYGRKKPESPIGKIMHSKAHADHCPFWNAEKKMFGEN